jgi:hypothetical protein
VVDSRVPESTSESSPLKSRNAGCSRESLGQTLPLRFRRNGACTEASRGTLVTFSELVRLLEAHGSKLLKEKGSVRYYAKPGVLLTRELTAFV